MWRLGRSLPSGVSTGSGGLGEEAVRAREVALGLSPGQPFLLRPDGEADVDVLAYFFSSSFGLLSEQTQLSYAKDLRIFLSFLEGQGRAWRSASVDDALDYEFWRRRDERNPRRVSASKFAREWAACQRFYVWQQHRGALTANGVAGSAVAATALRSHREARSSRVKWLMPKAYEQWRDVGLGGGSGEGGSEQGWRGRNEGRNVAFADLLWSSGLRLREAGSLLMMELPALDSGGRYLRGRVGPAVAKMRRGRDFWLSRSGRTGIEAYLVSSRALAVERARQAGRYESGTRLLMKERHGQRLLVEDEARGGQQRAVLVGDLPVRDRLRLFSASERGWEPAMVFLGESGLAMEPDSWERVFARASRRCLTLGVPVTCHPHMLRHSFALRMLLTLTHAFDRRMGLTPEERREYRLLFGDPWVLVQTLLGHRSPETTREIYLEPVSGLQVELFLNDDSVHEDLAFSTIVTEHLARSGTVNLGDTR